MKTKRNTPYPIFLVEVGISPIESMVETRCLMYKQKRNNMGGNKIPTFASNSNQNHLRLKWVGLKMPSLG